MIQCDPLFPCFKEALDDSGKKLELVNPWQKSKMKSQHDLERKLFLHIIKVHQGTVFNSLITLYRCFRKAKVNQYHSSFIMFYLFYQFMKPGYINIGSVCRNWKGGIQTRSRFHLFGEPNKCAHQVEDERDLANHSLCKQKTFFFAGNLNNIPPEIPRKL